MKATGFKASILILGMVFITLPATAGAVVLSANEPATIYYTTNGSDPTTTSTNIQAIDRLPPVKLSLKPLDLSKQISTEEIMSAGQLGGQLYPTHALKNAAREKEINNSFAAAIQEWNKHNYKHAVQLFKEHVKMYPDSQWEAEATLHCGCDAQYNGRYSEAEENFTSIRNNYKGKESEGAKKLVNKATLRLAVLKVAENNFDEAGKLFTELHKSSNDWRDKTYASHWLQRLSRNKADKLAMLNCGSLALAHVMEKEGRFSEAREVASLIPTSLSGYSVQELSAIAVGYGYRVTGLSIASNELEKAPLPAIVHLKGRNPGDGGHYWVLEKAAGEEVELFDPQAGRRYNQTVAEFSRMWDGAILALQDGSVSGSIGTKLSEAETKQRFGGCCGLPRPPEDLGDPCGGDPCCYNKGPSSSCTSCSSSNGEGAPVWSVNMVNMNLFMKDTPLWYEPAIGPPVRIALSYNSQASIVYNQPFGNKWQLNYSSYLVVDTGGQVTILMPDGRNDTYAPDGAGGYTKPFGVFNALTKLAENHFTLRFPDDTIYEYDIPAGTTSLQPFLVKITDRYGLSLTFGYNSDVHLVTITDALGQVTNIFYANGLATSVSDSFGRSATFEYTNGNLTKITDMGGYWTSLTYDQNVYLTSLGNSRGTWQFYVEPSDNIEANSNNYPPPGDLMWDNYRITVTNPLGGKEEYFYYGGCDYVSNNGCNGQSWYVSPKDYVPWLSQQVNNYRSVTPKKRYFFTKIPTYTGKGAISKIINPDGATTTFSSFDSVTGRPTSISDSHSPPHAVSFSYNSLGLVTSATDAKLKTTTMAYAPNKVDLTGVTNGLGTVSMGYNLFHNVTSATNRMGKTTRYAYNGYGQTTSITDPLTNVTSFNYYEPGHPSKYRLKEIVRAGKTLFSYVYDAIGRIFSRTDPTGLTLTYGYNDLNQVTSITWSDSKQELFNYSPCCPRLLDSYTDRGGRTTYYTYDSMRRLIQVKRPDKTIIKYEYDDDGNLFKFIDPNSGATKFEYDAMNRLVKKTYADNKYETYSYDGEGLLIAKANARDTAASRTTATYSYDANHNLTGITYTDGTPNVTYTPDDYNRVTSRTDGIGTWGYGYDAESRLLTVDGPWENDTVTHSWYDNDQQESVQAAGSEKKWLYYDPVGRLEHIKPDNARTFTYVYPTGSPTSLPESLTRPNGSFTTYHYDPLKRLDEIANKKSDLQLINSDAFTYNSRDMRDSETVTNGTPITNFTANQTIYSYNTVNQLLSTLTPNKAFTYDADGNMTSGYTPDGYQFTTTYDGENRLKSLDYNDGTAHHIDYFYSADGFLAKQLVDGLETRFVRSGYSLLQERDSTNNVTRSYVWNPQAPGGIGGLLELTQGGSRYNYLFDGKGNVNALIDGTQAPVAAYRYDEFGNLMAKSGTLDQPFRFSTKAYYEKTGLSYYGYRFYAPTLGRWMNKDPLGEAGGINLYGFLGNNALSFIDSYGLYLGQLPPPPPGYNPGTWSSGIYPNGTWWVRDPDGNRWLAHAEDDIHWRHWDKPDNTDGPDNDRWPRNCFKKKPGDRNKPKRSDTDPSGDAPSWGPNEFTNTDPLSPGNIIIPVVPINPQIPIIEWPLVPSPALL